MSTPIVTVHAGGMRCRTHWGDDEQSFSTDVAAAIGGRGEQPTPASLLAAAVASCMLSMVAHVGANKGFDTDGISIASTYETDAKGAISALTFEVSVPMATSPLVRRMIEAAVAHCPVGAAIAPTVAKKISWHWGE